MVRNLSSEQQSPYSDGCTRGTQIPQNVLNVPPISTFLARPQIYVVKGTNYEEPHCSTFSVLVLLILWTLFKFLFSNQDNVSETGFCLHPQIKSPFKLVQSIELNFTFYISSLLLYFPLKYPRWSSRINNVTIRNHYICQRHYSTSLNNTT